MSHHENILVVSGEMNLGGFVAGIIDTLCKHSTQMMDKNGTNPCKWSKIIAVGGGVWPCLVLAGTKIGDEQKLPVDADEEMKTGGNGNISDKKTCPKEILQHWISEKYDFTTEVSNYKPPFCNDTQLVKLLNKSPFHRLQRRERVFCSQFIYKNMMDTNRDRDSGPVVISNDSPISDIRDCLVANMSIYGNSDRENMDPIVLPDDCITDTEYEQSEIDFIILNYTKLNPMMVHLVSIRTADIIKHIKRCKKARIISAKTSRSPTDFNSDVRRELISLGEHAANRFMKTYYGHLMDDIISSDHESSIYRSNDDNV